MLPVLLEAAMDGTDYERLMALCGEIDLGAEPKPEQPAEEPEEKEPGTRLRHHVQCQYQHQPADGEHRHHLRP